jgi:hypothetical protein
LLEYRQRRLLSLDQRAVLRPPPDQVRGVRVKKIFFQTQLADLLVQKIDLPLTDRALRRRTADLKNPRRAAQQRLLWCRPNPRKRAGKREQILAKTEHP